MNILIIRSSPFVALEPRLYNQAKSLIKAGHKVTVLAWDKKRINPPQDVEGIHIVPSFNTKLMDVLPKDIFRLHLWWNKGYKDALKLYKQNPFDVINSHDLDSLPIGIKLKKKLGLPLIYDAGELWGYMVAKEVPWWRYYLWKEKRIIRYVDEITTVNEPLKKYFSKMIDQPITIIMNCKPLQGTEYEHPSNDRFTLLFIGTLGWPRFLLELVDVVKELPDVYCIIGGRGKPKYVKALKDKCSKVPNVDFVGLVPPDEIVPMTKKADTVVCMTDPRNLNNRWASANKQFEAMLCGRPIICTEGTYPGEFTEKEECGIVVLQTKEDLKRGIIKLRDNPQLREKLGRNALKAAIREYNWERQEEKLLIIYEKLKK